MKLFKKKFFFGWNNIKWFIRECRNIASGKKSFFSQKRIQQLVAFGVLMWGAVYYMINKVATMGAADFVLWSTVPASIDRDWET